MAVKILGDDWIEAAQAAQLFNLKERTIKNKAARGEIPGALIGRQWFFNIDILRDFIKKQFEKKAEQKASKEAAKQCLSSKEVKKVSTGMTSQSTKLDTAARLRQLRKTSRNVMKMN